ncbi:MAG: helix-turn-helix transcriptional regulator [Candidatus Omnitrophota bacterium]
MKIGEELKKVRIRKGLSQERLARLLNVTTRTIQRWESGLDPSELQLAKVEEFIKKER